MTETRQLATPDRGIELSAKQWEQLLRETFKDFKGNPETAGLLLSELCSGVRETFASHGRGKYKLLSLPKVSFVLTTSREDGHFYYSHDKNYMGVMLDRLAEDSLLSPTDIIQAKDELPPHDLYFVGSVQDYYRCGGWEEGHHALVKATDAKAKGVYSVRRAESDASAPEYKGLRWQIRMAKKLNIQDSTRFPWYTQRVMEARFHQATLYKKKPQQFDPLTLKSLGIYAKVQE